MRTLLAFACRKSIYMTFFKIFLGQNQQIDTVSIINSDLGWLNVKEDEKAVVDCGYRQL